MIKQTVSKKVQDLAREMQVHGTQNALVVLAPKHTADEIVAAANVAVLLREGWSMAQATKKLEAVYSAAEV